MYDPATGHRRILVYTGVNSNNKDIVVDPTTGQVNIVSLTTESTRLITTGGCIGLTMMQPHQKYSEFQWMEQLGPFCMTPT